MGNIEEELKSMRKKAHKEIILGNFTYACLPAILISSIIVLCIYVYKTISNTYQIYWQLLKHNGRILIELIPIGITSMLLAYVLLASWYCISDIIKYNKTK